MDCQERTALIVDDDRDFTRMCAELLESLSFKVYKAYNADEALQVLDNKLIDLCVIDQVMPERCGLELVSDMRRQQYQYPVLFCTGYDTTPIEQQRATLRINGILRKPIDLNALSQFISHHCGQSRMAPPPDPKPVVTD